jgi:hypothetical protein
MTRTSEPTGSIDIQRGERIDENLHPKARSGRAPSSPERHYASLCIPGTHMRHALSTAKPSAVLTLPVAVIGPALRTPLVFATGSPYRLTSCLLRATRGAVRVPTIA